MTWLLVTTIPSERTMTPDPTDSATRAWGMPPPKNWKKGSAWTRCTLRAEILTTAGAAERTTGAKLDFIPAASDGAVRVGWANSPSCAFELLGLPHADRAKAAASTIDRVFMSIQKVRLQATPYRTRFRAGSRRVSGINGQALRPFRPVPLSTVYPLEDAPHRLPFKWGGAKRHNATLDASSVAPDGARPCRCG